jgi:phosphoglycerol transferase MdoB-like AlkP superfamily enzyme
VVFNISRFALAYTYHINIDIPFLIYSLRMDIIVVSAFLIIPIILYSLNLFLLTRVVLSTLLIIFVYLEVANYLFFEEFHTRLNYIFVEYLQYPQEVFAMIWKSYHLQIIVLIPILIFIFIKFFNYSKSQITNFSIFKKILLLPFILVLLFLGARSSTSASTPNQSFYSCSNSVLKNDIVDNTTFSLLYAMYLKSKSGMPNFGKLNHKLTKTNLNHFQKSTFTKKDKIVLILMESFGNSYVGCMGGTPTTPNFDKMTKDGLFMNNMYSSSNRSNRGFEAVTSSIFPTYANTYLNLPKSQSHFWTIAKTMQEKGYQTIFLYGGDSKFDNMKGFALGNGFDKVIDKFDFDKNIKRYTWGVDDEELYKKAQQILKNSKQPIFLVMFTLSSHKPFDYPLGKIKYYKKAPIASFANSMKYADFALGNFYKDLKQNNFFNNGVLAMVADHNAHITGNHLIPVDEFRIPALFIAKDLAPKRYTNTTDQIDIAPTLLDIAGINATIPAMGTDLTKSNHSRALLIHRGRFAYIKDKSFVVYQKNKTAQIFNFKYKKLKYNKPLVEEGLDYLYSSYYIYNNLLHKDINNEKH